MISILLLEDNIDVADSMMGAFRLRGWAATLATTVEAAKHAYTPDRFDVIVCDYELPDGVGLDFIATIRGSDKARVVLHSGLDRSREIAATGMDVDQISKADPSALIDMITEVADANRSAADSESLSRPQGLENDPIPEGVRYSGTFHTDLDCETCGGPFQVEGDVSNGDVVLCDNCNLYATVYGR